MIGNTRPVNFFAIDYNRNDGI